MKGYSTEYLSTIVLAIIAGLKIFDIEISETMAADITQGIIAVVAVVNLLVKRFKRGDVTPLGFRR